MMKKNMKVKALLMAGLLTITGIVGTTLETNKYNPSASNSITEMKSSQSGTTTGSVNMRSGASTKYKVLNKLKKNTKVDVLKKVSNNWYQIKYKGKIGYISGKYLKLTNTSTNTNTVTAVKTYKNQAGTTTTSSLNMRKGYSTKHKVLTKLKKNAKVDVLKKMSNNWYQIKYKGKTGYISGKYLKLTSTSTNTVTTVKTYKNQAGTTTTSSLNMRKGYSTKHNVVTKLKKNTKVDVLKKMSNGWYQIKYKGKTGYVSGSYLKLTTKPDDNTNIPKGISMEEFNKWLLLNGFNSKGYYYEENGNSSARVRVIDNEACYSISSVSGNFKKALKESLNLLLPTKGNELYNTIVNNSFKEQRIKMDGRNVYLCPVSDGIILEIK